MVVAGAASRAAEEEAVSQPDSICEECSQPFYTEDLMMCEYCGKDALCDSCIAQCEHDCDESESSVPPRKRKP